MKHRTLGKRHCSLKSLKELGLPKSKLTLRFVLALAQKRIFSVKIQRGKFWCQFLSARTEEQKKAFWLETWQTGKVCSWPRTGRLCNRRWTPPRTLLVPVCLAVVRLVKFDFCREPKGYFKNSPTPAILTGKVGDGSCLLLLLFFKFIHVLFIQSHRLLPLLYTTHFGKKKWSLVVKLLLMEGWSFGQCYNYTSGLLLRALHSECCCGDKLRAVKAREYAGFHSNPVACDRLKMKGYKSLPGWPWGLATVILWGWIQPKTPVAWHADILSVLFHYEVSNIPEMWF